MTDSEQTPTTTAGPRWQDDPVKKAAAAKKRAKTIAARRQAKADKEAKALARKAQRSAVTIPVDDTNGHAPAPETEAGTFLASIAAQIATERDNAEARVAELREQLESAEGAVAQTRSELTAAEAEHAALAASFEAIT
jgi:DNA repair exonuclease SbcCD ATPase subunit